MSEREIPMNLMKTLGPNTQYQCACGRKFFTNNDSGQNKVLYNGKTCPKCPECQGVFTGSKLSDFQKGTAAEGHKMFTACVAYGGNKCRGKFIGEAASMAEFMLGISMAMMQMGLPMDGIDIKEVDAESKREHRENYHMASHQQDIAAMLMAMMMAHGMKMPSDFAH